MMRTITCFAAFALLTSAPAQRQIPGSPGAHDKLTLQLRTYVQQHTGLGQEVDLFVRGGTRRVESRVRALGGVVKYGMRGLLAVRMPVDRIEELAQDAAVTGFEFSLDRGVALNDSARVHARIVPVQQGLAPLPQAYDGTGVIVGIIDTGTDFRHADLKDQFGNTRVLKYWDHYLAFDAVRTPPQYGYGQVFNAADINANLCPSTDHNFGHGTTVAGAAASNGLATGQFVGAAPAADLIIVSSKLSLPNWRATIADAVHYIVTEAQALGRPCVINCSLGSYLGSHDGLDATALLIDSILTAERGHMLVCAGGNSGGYPAYHMRTNVGSDTSFTWFQHEAVSVLGVPGMYFDLWADTAQFGDVQFAVGADRVSPTYQYRGRTPFHDVSEIMNVTVTDTLWSFGGARIGIAQYYAELRGAQVHMEVAVAQPDSNAYYFRFMTTGSGRFDVWSSNLFAMSDMVTTIPNAVDFPPIVDYVMPDNLQSIVDSWACSPQVLTVGNYYNETIYVAANDSVVNVGGTEGMITGASSRGPSRDDRVKPDLAAPGDITLSCGPPALLTSFLATQPWKLSADSLHMRNGGTSMASPVVAGAVALLLQKCPYAFPSDIIGIINGSAYTDAFTGAVPNTSYGHGKLDAFAALVSTNFTAPTISAPDGTIFCPGDSLQALGPAGGANYDWSDGDTDNPGYANTAGPYSLLYANVQGCTAYSDTITFSQYPAPVPPGITQVGYVLSSTPADAYQWFQDGLPIGGANAQDYEVIVTGNYFVQITDANGCTANSDTLFVLVTGIGGTGHPQGGISTWPLPAHDELFIGLPTTGNGAPFELEIIDSHGRAVHHDRLVAGTEQLHVPIGGWACGAYALRVVQGNERWVAVVMVN